MALSEKREITEITFSEKHISVKWVNTIYRDDVALQEHAERKTYCEEQKDEFIKEVADSTKYLAIMNW